jgi:hypothetical protein
MIRAIVKAGQYSDPAAEKLLVDVLIKRRDKIGQAYMTNINPLVDFSLNGSQVLVFENAAVKSGVGKTPGSYAASWSIFDNNTGETKPLGETKGSGTSIPAPTNLPTASESFVLAEVRAIDSAYPSWAKPVRVFFRRASSGWKLVGLERMAEHDPTLAVKK